MTKEEKIKEAYCEHWEDLHPQAKKSALENNGWIASIIEHAPKKIDLEFNKMTFRPKSLQRIENNNGWIKIEREEDFPKESDDYHICIENKDLSIAYFDKHDGWFIACPEITHYQPITKPKPPIY